MRSRVFLIATAGLCLAGCGAFRGGTVQGPTFIPFVATPAGYNPNEITSPTQLLSPPQAADAIKLTVAQVQPLLLPTAIPAGSDAYVAASRSRFSVTYVSKPTAQRVFFSIGMPSPPPLGPHAVVSIRAFRGTLATYSVDEPSQPVSYRALAWIEPGTWSAQVSANGIPYLLSATGLSDAQFWRLAGSIDAIPWPPAPRPCQSTEVAAIYGGGMGATGHIINAVLLANTGKTACSLQGYPQVSLTLANGSALAARQVNANPMGPVPAGPVVLQPGSPAPVPHTEVPGGAMLFFEWYDCQERTVSVGGLVVELPAGGGKLVVPAGQPAPGGLSSSRCDDPSQGKVLYVGPFQGAALNAPTAAPPAQLAVALRAPATVVAGQLLQYQVTLTNVSGAPFHFDACPPYREAMDTVPRKQVLGIYQLNCAPVGTLPPGGAATFSMVLEVSWDVPTGPQQLSWRFGPFFMDGSATAPVAISSH